MGILSAIFGRRPPQSPPGPLPSPDSDLPGCIRITPDFQHALDAVDAGVSPLFITGHAGTGKSTLLRLLRHRLRGTNKNVVVVAPTGIAALNVQGATAYSFFRLPPTVLTRDSIEVQFSKVEVMKKIDMLIIDEVSMVRADLLDAIELSLRKHRRDDRPFGGVQVVLFGDICQLPPVVKGENALKYFSEAYETPFFFSCNALQGLFLHRITLREIFRQSDGRFIHVLDQIRTATASSADLDQINTRRAPLSALDRNDHPIVLTTTNRASTRINQERLSRLPVPEQLFAATISGSVETDSYPAERYLRLRKGAQVMMLRNSGARWVNGSIGVVTGWADDHIAVRIDGTSHTVEREAWQIIDYEYDSKVKRLKEVVVGTFCQFPIRLAWSITIHKSQGQTFDRVHIDLDRGAFAHGQVYVALSRCRSLEGITLEAPLLWNDLLFDGRVRKFLENESRADAKGQSATSGERGLKMPTLPTIECRPQPRDEEVSAPDSNQIAVYSQAIRSAMAGGGSVKIDYVDYTGRRSSRLVKPKCWIDDDKFTAFCMLRCADRDFRVSRMLTCEVLSDSMAK